MFRITDVKDGTERMKAKGVLGKINLVVFDNATNEDAMFIYATVFQSRSGSIYIKRKYEVRKGTDDKEYADISFTESFANKILNSAKSWAITNNKQITFLGTIPQNAQATRQASSGPMF